MSTYSWQVYQAFLWSKSACTTLHATINADLVIWVVGHLHKCHIHDAFIAVLFYQHATYLYRHLPYSLDITPPLFAVASSMRGGL